MDIIPIKGEIMWQPLMDLHLNPQSFIFSSLMKRRHRLVVLGIQHQLNKQEICDEIKNSCPMSYGDRIPSFIRNQYKDRN